MTIGAKKKMETVSASCRVCRARKLKKVEPSRQAARTTCMKRLWVRKR
jgi:hypothetical protein